MGTPSLYADEKDVRGQAGVKCKDRSLDGLSLNHLTTCRGDLIHSRHVSLKSHCALQERTKTPTPDIPGKHPTQVRA